MANNKNAKTSAVNPIISTLNESDAKRVQTGYMEGKWASVIGRPVYFDDSEVIAAMKLDSFTYNELRTALDGKGHRHAFGVVTFLAKYIGCDPKGDEANVQVSNLIAALYAHYEDMANRSTKMNNLGDAEVSRRKMKALAEMLQGEYQWTRAKVVSQAQTRRFATNAGASLLSRILGGNGNSGDADNNGDDENGADNSAEIAEIQKEIGKLEFAVGFATKGNKQKMEKKIADLKAKLADLES